MARIFDECFRVCDYNRKYTIRLFNAPHLNDSRVGRENMIDPPAYILNPRQRAPDDPRIGFGAFCADATPSVMSDRLTREETAVNPLHIRSDQYQLVRKLAGGSHRTVLLNDLQRMLPATKRRAK